MIRFFLNRELSARLGFRLSRWKRWSREFLPPDPLGGLQSGFARQFSLPEAFQVFLGGHLVADLKYSIPEAKTILGNLKEWVTNQYFSYPLAEKKISVQQPVKEYRIYIFINKDPKQPDLTHSYMVRRLIDEESAHGKGARIVTERYLDTWINDVKAGAESDLPGAVPNWMAARVLYITKVYQIFTARLSENGSSPN